MLRVWSLSGPTWLLGRTWPYIRTGPEYLLRYTAGSVANGTSFNISLLLKWLCFVINISLLLKWLCFQLLCHMKNLFPEVLVARLRYTKLGLVCDCALMLACFTCLLSVRFLSWREINSNCLAIKCVSSLLQSAEGSSVLSWVHSVPASDVVTYYAFTFPYSYTLLQQELSALDKRLSIAPQQQKTQTDSSAESAEPSNSSHKASIYYVRELSINSLDGHRLDLLTVTSFLGITNIRENSLPGLFPDKSQQRPFKFANKKIIFISARVHPGETPASFVFNGFLDFITSDDPRAVKLRDLYVFKLMPMLNPDGVVRGHYRTDQLGVNLNRVYISPRIELHPTIFAARSLLIYYHNGTITSPETLSNDEFFRPSSLSSDNILSRKTSSNQPNILDEDTCHSFSDAGTSQEAKNFGKIAASHMEMDEPSASGWDISSNLSLDSNIHSNLSLDSNIRSNLSLDSNIQSNPVVFRAPEIPEMQPTTVPTYLVLVRPRQA